MRNEGSSGFGLFFLQTALYCHWSAHSATFSFCGSPAANPTRVPRRFDISIFFFSRPTTPASSDGADRPPGSPSFRTSRRLPVAPRTPARPSLATRARAGSAPHLWRSRTRERALFARFQGASARASARLRTTIAVAPRGGSATMGAKRAGRCGGGGDGGGGGGDEASDGGEKPRRKMNEDVRGRRRGALSHLLRSRARLEAASHAAPARPRRRFAAAAADGARSDLPSSASAPSAIAPACLVVVRRRARRRDPCYASHPTPHDTTPRTRAQPPVGARAALARR